MADDKFRRRRRRGEYSGGSHHGNPRHRDDTSPSPCPRKPPITILGLAKPSRVSSPSKQSEGDTPNTIIHNQTESTPTEANGGMLDKPTTSLSGDNSRSRPIHVMSKSNDTGQSDSASQGSGEDGSSAATSSVKRSTPGSMISSVIDQNAQMQSKLAPPLEKQGKIKIVDEHFQWCDTGLELMLEQTDFLVVGIIGLQGCGKSTILSLLAGNSHQDAYRNYLFFPQTKETKEDCLFQTSGIDMFVTPDRVILLDTEPLLSASMMDCLLRYERKYPPEYTSLQHYIEMQSLQLVTFLLSVCNIVLVADDWFIDLNALRLVLDAEMLKPSTQPSSSADSQTKDLASELHPTIIFVHNRATRQDFSSESYFSMQKVLHEAFSDSVLNVHNGLTMTRDWAGEPIINQLPRAFKDPAADVNLLLLPLMEFYKSEPECLETSLPEYRGYPSFNTILSFFRSQILSAQRQPISHSPLSEKNWYHFSARMWESVRKSPLLLEYNRLLSY